MDTQTLLLISLFIIFCCICATFYPQKKHMFRPNHLKEKSFT